MTNYEYFKAIEQQCQQVLQEAQKAENIPLFRDMLAERGVAHIGMSLADPTCADIPGVISGLAELFLTMALNNRGFKLTENGEIVILPKSNLSKGDTTCDTQKSETSSEKSD